MDGWSSCHIYGYFQGQLETSPPVFVVSETGFLNQNMMHPHKPFRGLIKSFSVSAYLSTILWITFLCFSEQHI